MSARKARSPDATAAEDLFAPIPADFRLASGEALPDAHVALRRHGPADAPLVLVMGGISAGKDVCGAGGWWRSVAGPGGAIDLSRYAVLGADFAPEADQRVRINPADQARLIALALDALGIGRLHGFVGASYGGMVGLALAAHAPERLARLCVISAAAKPSALSSAWRGVQRRVVEFALQQNCAADGLALARQLAMITYRSGEEFEARFGGGVGADGLGELDRYLIARGQAYVDVMHPQRWLSLSEAIDRFSVDPATIATPTTVVACPTDQIAPFADMQDLARKLPQLTQFYALPSLYGHDAFLKEADQLRPILGAFLDGDAA